MNPQNFRSSSRPVDLASGHLQSLPDMLGIDFVQRKHASISSCVESHFMNQWNLLGQKGLRGKGTIAVLDQGALNYIH
jgi:hypothetical protein